MKQTLQKTQEIMLIHVEPQPFYEQNKIPSYGSTMKSREDVLKYSVVKQASAKMK